MQPCTCRSRNELGGSYVTEGATDRRILRESLDAVVPDLRDFFVTSWT